MARTSFRTPKIISLKEFRLNAQGYINAVTRGQTFVVVKRSRPAFRMEPIDEQWEVVSDFTLISRSGVDAKKILSVLE